MNKDDQDDKDSMNTPRSHQSVRSIFADTRLVKQQPPSMPKPNSYICLKPSPLFKREVQSLHSNNDYTAYMNARFIIQNEIDRLTHFKHQLDCHIKGEYDFHLLNKKALSFLSEVKSYTYTVLYDLYEDYVNGNDQLDSNMKADIMKKLNPNLKDFVNEITPVVEYNRDDGANRYEVLMHCRPSENIKIYLSNVKENGDIEMKNYSVIFYTQGRDNIYNLSKPSPYSDLDPTNIMTEKLQEHESNNGKKDCVIKSYKGHIFKNLTIQIPMYVYEMFTGTDLFVFMDLKNMIELTRYVR